MSERRCPSCGGLVGADAEWCTQCFARLDDAQPTRPVEQAHVPGEGSEISQPSRPAAEAPTSAEPPGRPAAPQGAAPIRVTAEAIVWDCPVCGTENPIDAMACSACGTRFGQAFEEPEEKPEVDPGRAATASVFFPGAGHFVAGRRSEGFARAVVFAFALIMGLAAIGPVRAGSGGIYLALMVLSLSAAAGMYAISIADAGRAARGEQQILSMRVLLYGAVGLIFMAIVLLTFAATRADG
jgi:hypothetical protein